MKNFIQVVKEINRTLNGIILFSTLIHSVLLFLAIYLFLTLINLYPISALIPASVYFIFSAYTKMRVNKAKVVESKYEHLKERLRTAVDNVNLENPVVEELQNEVVQGLKQVGISSFLHTKKVSYKVLASAILAFIIVFVSTLNIHFLDLQNLINNIPGLLEGTSLIKKSENIPLEVNTTEDIYGESKLAVLGNKELDIKIQPSNFEVSVREQGDVKQKKFDEVFPKEVEIKSGASFEENIPQEQQELVKSYFKKLAKG